MDEDALKATLDRIVDTMVSGKAQPRTFPRYGLPIDVTKPNFHDNKGAFLAEKGAVQSACDHADGLFEFIASAFAEDDNEVREIGRRVLRYVDAAARKSLSGQRPDTIAKFVVKGMVEVGLSVHLAIAMIEYRSALRQRLQELADQEAEFWSGASRPPNHYARTIALRLARFYARETGAFPTVGVSADGGHPSTSYTSALEATFEVLKIKANVRNAATWAVRQLTDEDTMPGTNALSGLLGWVEPEVPVNPVAEGSAKISEKDSL